MDVINIISGLLPLFIIAYGCLGVLLVLRLLYIVLYPPRKSAGRALASGDAIDPADLGLTAESVMFSYGGMNQSPGWLIRGGAPAGPVVIMVHGYGDSRFGSLSRVRWFMPHAKQIVIFDLRAHGDSTSPRSYAGIREWRDVQMVIEQLHDTGEVVLYGSSMGGRIALAAAAMAGGDLSARIRGVIVDGVYRTWHEPLKRLMKIRRQPSEPYISLCRLVLTLVDRRFGRFDACDHAASLDCPMLVLHGSADRLCHPASARAIAAAAKAGKLVIFEGGGHLNLQIVQEDRYRDELAAFFREKVKQTDEPCQSDRPYEPEA